MRDASKSPQRANYGIDAPDVVLRFFVIGIIGLILGSVCIAASRKGILPWTRFVAGPCLGMGGLFLVQSGVMLWGSKAGKVRFREKLLDSISLGGGESVLDVGCGHGLMLIGAAKRLTTGRALGIDLWQKEDQAGNSREATGQNVQIENVAGRVELLDGDARKLPFPENSFDVVLSSWALHNIYDRAGRDTAIREIIRVLRPGGRMVIVDIRHTREYAEILGEAGMLDIHRAGPSFLFIIPSFTLRASKPGSRSHSPGE